jgi:hypothetical protein
MNRLIKVVAAVLLAPFVLLLAGIGGCEARKAYYDWQVRRMCERDGGVAIFDKVPVTRSQLDALGKVGGHVSIPPKNLAGPDSPAFSTYEREVIKEGSPSIRKWVETVVRSSDNKVVARVTSYTRSGGDFPSHAEPSSFTCPPAIERFADREKIFVLSRHIRVTSPVLTTWRYFARVNRLSKSKERGHELI